MPIPVIAIFDIGKTNKKAFLFDEAYAVRFEKSDQLPEIKDEDGFPCEDIESLTRWVENTYSELLKLNDFEIRAVNFSAHGASFVNVDKNGNPVTPLYNYLKPYPEDLQQAFYTSFGGDSFPIITASPVLGHLNSGMQLYWLKKQRPEVFNKIKYALHLPEYISWLFTKRFVSGITSIGCHTNLWDFTKNKYHDWVYTENIVEKLAPIDASDQVYKTTGNNHTIEAGIGLHDSSSALIPYLKYFTEPFVLISTGTWSISLNPFNHLPLTSQELEKDCLCYLTFEGNPVKASRLFAGQEHDDGVKQIAKYFNTSVDFYKQTVYDQGIIEKLKAQKNPAPGDVTSFSNPEEAYHSLIASLVKKQKTATAMVIQNTSIGKIFVDGGFSQNDIYMKLLANTFPGIEVYAASLHQATALGAAIVIHDKWNTLPLPSQLIQTIRYSS